MSRKRPPPDWAQRPHDINVVLEAPAPEDIVLGRGNQHANHPGNARFYEIIDAHIPQYDAATSKFEKSRVVQSIYESVSSTSRFVKKDKDATTYSVVDDAVARQKISHAIRYRKASTQPQTQQRDDGKEEQKQVEDSQGANDSCPRAPIEESKLRASLDGNMVQPVSFDGNMMERMIQPSNLAGVTPIPDTFGNQIVFPNNQPGKLQLHSNFAQATMPFGAHGWNGPQLAAFGFAMGGGTAASAPSNNIPPPPVAVATAAAAAALPQVETRNRSLNDSPESSLDSDLEKFLMENFSKEGG